jgi:hypothetical protein
VTLDDHMVCVGRLWLPLSKAMAYLVWNTYVDDEWCALHLLVVVVAFDSFVCQTC